MAITRPTRKNAPGGTARWIVISALVLGAFFGAYGLAQARGARGAQGASAGSRPTASAPAGFAGGPAAQGQGGAGGAGGAGACACCGSSAPTADGVTGDAAEGAAAQSGGAQTISVDLSKGYYEPNVIKLKAGVPAQITFGQSSGCTGQVTSQDLGFFEDLTTGPKTVTIDNPKPGTYAFSCGMQMVFGKIVVE